MSMWILMSIVIILVLQPIVTERKFQFNTKKELKHDLSHKVSRLILELDKMDIYKGHTQTAVSKISTEAYNIQDKLQNMKVNKLHYNTHSIERINSLIQKFEGLKEKLNKIYQTEETIQKHLTELKIHMIKNNDSRLKEIYKEIENALYLDIIEAEILMKSISPLYKK